ncbi:MAG TPA: hypothetical protein DET40_12555 [Lentisphaeria bacterium]|nr:MAG: hypothetical protein A2X45_00540 [Lentisphaerae bacterium GWF2_50_93]HCE44370.1 hypothetical protein [Lentisphaeria bacterium]
MENGAGPIHLKEMKIIASDERTTMEYERLATPMELEVVCLARKIQNLRRTRDLLLPRLPADLKSDGKASCHGKGPGARWLYKGNNSLNKGITCLIRRCSKRGSTDILVCDGKLNLNP